MPPYCKLPTLEGSFQDQLDRKGYDLEKPKLLLKMLWESVAVV
jgi:hypothetical protein